MINVNHHRKRQTTESDKPPKATESAKTATSPIILLCLNQTTRYRGNTKVDFSLPFKPIIPANSEAIEPPLLPLMLSTILSINAPKESHFDPNHTQIARSSRALKSRQSSNISSTSIRVDSRPGYVRWQIWLINCWLRGVES